MNRITHKLLVLDDDPFMLKLIAHMLESHGCSSVATCDNARTALEKVDSTNECPDLILLDLNMPDMDGLEFIRHLGKHRYTGSLILMSGEDEYLLQAAGRLVRAHRIPLLGRFRKPVTAEVLASFLERFPAVQQNGHLPGNEAYSADELRAAIYNGELINYYQPKVSLCSGRVVGVETLVRWRNPRIGMIYPYKFLGVAERFGVINDLTRTVMTSALAQARSWLDQGITLQMVINVSVYDLESPDFADMVVELTTAAGIAPQNIMLEVAEGWLLMHDMRAPLETLARLRMKHFKLSIDDFGTGYSSVAQLRGMPFDELKFNRDFVRRMATDDKMKVKYNVNQAIARQLNLQLAAVGVEDIEEWAMLRQNGCDFVQGSFIAYPMPAEKLVDWMQDWELRVREEGLFDAQDCSV